MTAKETEAIIPDPSTREKALNFLLGVGLLKTLIDANRKVSFRAVTKGELVVYVNCYEVIPQVLLDSRHNSTRDLNGEENLVFSHIKAAGNEGTSCANLSHSHDVMARVSDCQLSLTHPNLRQGSGRSI
jgi:DNA-directed RNA polymerase III subunit RPC6